MVVYRIVLTDEYIEDAQHVNIAQNRALRLIYQTGWVRWFPRVTFAATSVLLVVVKQTAVAVVTGASFLLTFAGQFYLRWTLAKARRRIRFKGSTLTLRMDENGVEIDGAVGHTHLRWGAMPPPVIRHHGILIKLTRLRGIWLPDVALVEGSAAEARQLLASRVQAA